MFEFTDAVCQTTMALSLHSSLAVLVILSLWGPLGGLYRDVAGPHSGLDLQSSSIKRQFTVKLGFRHLVYSVHAAPQMVPEKIQIDFSVLTRLTFKL